MKKSLIFSGVVATLVVFGIAALLIIQSKPLMIQSKPLTAPGGTEMASGETTQQADTSMSEDRGTPIVVKTYSDPSMLFEIDYPDFYLVSTTAQASGEYGILKSYAVTIQSPEQERAGTNLIESAVVVGYSKSAQDIRSCVTAQTGETRLGSIVVNGQAYAIYTSEGAAAGNFYQTVRYRTVKKQTCFEATLMMRFGNIDNYPKDTVKEFDRPVTLERLKAIFYSLRLL